ncbi:P22 phage major capsid protein family protein [Streptomyces sp. ND04-05B]|uniref:P22 phage major capsid protein family protein n=1 Tax=Streptomyces sp. ND04-05B TaxID=3028693 RepID=UPI0029AE8A12|nr:P22 phage major capsid protein family protein [Streptomyces sp. ND04-05B]MDX3066502.1 P22 phage major capsid protein family protein [Streptomyces sp. ND04-05B]
MANTFLTPDIIARRALATLYESTHMAMLVHRDYEADFAGRVGDTITVRKPATFTATEFNRGTGIVPQNATESGVPVVLNHFPDVSVAVTTEQLTLEIDDFGTQLLDPMMEAMAQKIDRDLLTLRDDITQTIGAVAENTAGEDYNYPGGQYPWSDSRVLIEAGRVLDQQNVPPSERRVVVGPLTKSRWVAERTWREADKRGDTEGLREASFGGRVSGFDPYMTQNVQDPEESVAFHKTAFALVTRTLEVPPGAQDATIMNYKGFALRVVYDYDIKYKQTVVSVDCLYGTKTLDADRAVLISDGTGS